MSVAVDGVELQPARRPGLVANVRERLADSFGAFGEVFRIRDLRRLQLAWVGSVLGEWAFGVALAVYAYEQGGAAAVGLAGLLRTALPMLGATFTSSLGDRYDRVHVMVGSDLVRGVLFTIGAVAIITGGPPVLLYIIGGLVLLAATAFRPAQASLLPKLTKTPEQLTASNVVSTTVESVGFFLGPALAGVLLIATSAEVVFAVSAVTCLWSAALVATVRVPDDHETPEPVRKGGRFRQSLEGFAVVSRDRDLRLLLGLFTSQTLVCGALNVLTVVLALEVLDAGEGGVGLLTAAVGVGGILGAVAAAGLVGRKRLAGGFLIGLVLWGAPLIVMGVLPSVAVVALMMAAVGLGNTLVDVAGFTLMQRAVPDEVMSRVFGVLEVLLMASIGLGAILTPVLVSWLGAEEACIAIGCLLPVLALLSWRRLRDLDSGAEVPIDALEALRRIAFFRPLPVIQLEELARQVETIEVVEGDDVIREGDVGDRFYMVADGHFEVRVDGSHAEDLRVGECFGEIALLRDVPRTATVTARGPGKLMTLERDDFVSAITGSATSAAAADEVVAARLAASRPFRRGM